MPAAFDASACFSWLTESGGPSSIPPEFSRSAAFGWLLSQSLIVPGPNAISVPCALCRSVHTPEPRQDGTMQIVCQDGPEPVQTEQLLRWQTNWPALCAMFNKAFSPSEPVRVLISSQLCRVGWSGKPDAGFPVWLVRGFSRALEAQSLLNALSADNRHQRGVVVSAFPLQPTLRLPSGLKSVWLGDCFTPALEAENIDLTPIKMAGYPTGPSAPKKRGRPPKPGDPVREFIKRVNAGTALKAIGKEAASLHALECKTLPDPKLAFGASTIEKLIQEPFNRWKEQGYPRPFTWP